jgi:hypothetical protein
MGITGMIFGRLNNTYLFQCHRSLSSLMANFQKNSKLGAIILDYRMISERQEVIYERGRIKERS